MIYGPSCERAENASGRQIAIASEIAGLKCAPLIRPNREMEMMTTRPHTAATWKTPCVALLTTSALTLAQPICIRVDHACVRRTFVGMGQQILNTMTMSAVPRSSATHCCGSRVRHSRRQGAGGVGGGCSADGNIFCRLENFSKFSK